MDIFNLSGRFLTASALLASLAASHLAAAAPHFVFETTDLPPVYDTRDKAHSDYLQGMALADFNGDELPDMFIGHGRGQNDILMLQDPETGWLVSTLDPSNTDATHAALAVDLNRDFRQDLIVARASGTYIYLNNNGQLSAAGKLPAPAERQGGATTMALVAGDLTGDGWIDIVETRRDGSAGDGDRIWINRGTIENGKPVFREESATRGTNICCSSAGATLHDIEGDGDLDILIASPGAFVTLLTNDGDGNFAASEQPLIAGDWRSIVATDIDNDDDIDLIVAGVAQDPEQSSLRVLEYDKKLFHDRTESLGVNVTTPVRGFTVVDLDADGTLDLSIASESPANPFAKAVRYLRNRGRGRGFTDETATVDLPVDEPLQMLSADIDKDGLPDQLVLGVGGKAGLLRNAVNRVNWLSVNLRGRDDRSIAGTRVLLRMQDGTHMTRFLRRGEGVGMDSDDILLFGFGRRNNITVMEITWPSGNYTRVDGLTINRHHGFIEPKDEHRDDVSIKYPLFGFIEAQNKRMRENPELREKLVRPQPRYVCR